MKVIVATEEPHFQALITPHFETAPFYVAFDTHTGRATLVPHPLQYQVECPPEGLLQRLAQYSPDVVLAGAFSPEVRRAASALQLALRATRSYAADVLAPGTGLPVPGCWNG